MNYLLTVDDTDTAFKEKIFGRKELKEYLSAKNLENYKPNPSISIILILFRMFECDSLQLFDLEYWILAEV